MATNSRMQGGVGVGAAIAYFMKNEIPVFVPLVDYSDYDLVVDLDGLQKVQVRTSYFARDGKFLVNMKVCGGNAKGNKTHKLGTDMEYDYIFIYLENGCTYLIPKSEVSEVKSQLTMGKKYEKFKV